MATPKNFLDLQNGFYNALAQGLGYSNQDPFQVIQPSPPLASGADADALLWAYLNNIPVASLTQNTVFSGGNQFLANYQGVMSALQAAPNQFKSTIGQNCYNDYVAARKAKEVGPTPAEFRDWAMLCDPCSAVATSGASALARAMLDPVFAAQNNVLPYKPAGTEPVDFMPGYQKMLTLLKAAPSRSFSVSANSWQSDVSRTWTQGSNSGFFGLWGGSSSESTLSQKFASSGVGLQASFENVLPFNATPGNWYSSAAFGMAFNNPNKKPWDPEAAINWETTFGKSGNLQRFATSLLIANKMAITVQSAATYNEQEQQEIRNNSGAGMWPFYSTSSSSGSSTSVAFNTSGNMVVQITSKPDVPVVIGCIVLSAAQYLGHEAEVSKYFLTQFYG
ncbi:hypothetical protein [Trinickia fusca]|uniref:Uncharacterized protein n=1 Tax=Trinickia fusca TaxID=2419777 RepID=A0A494X7A7_9BURK|nr:hypothetical protein [Trinickia fusca]RKP43889.1 hypothetical protein D7S89_24760 [Trinickia fusca]